MGVICLIPFLKSPAKLLSRNGYLALAMMLMIYLGAYLATGTFVRVMYEIVFAALVLGLGLYFKKLWPIGIAGLVFLHGGYDHFLGAKSGIADWYPPLCAGFDVVVGLGLGYLIFKRNRQRL